jgi:uncharacterized membrane protein
MSDVVLIGRFSSVTAAEDAAPRLVTWAQAESKITLSGVAVVSRDPQGELLTQAYGPATSTGKGLKLGTGLGVLAAVVSGGLSLIPTAIAGAAAGGLLGSMAKKDVKLTDTQLEQLWGQLEGDQAALLVMCDQANVADVSAQVGLEGGTVDSDVLVPHSQKDSS